MTESDDDDDTYQNGTGSPWGVLASTGSANGYCSSRLTDEAKKSGTKRCPATATQTVAGPARAKAECSVERSFYGSAYHHQGADDARRYSCRATFVIRPASPLSLIIGGIRNVGIYAGSAGEVTLGAARKTTGRVAQAAVRRKAHAPVLRTVSARLTGPGIARLPLKLTKPTARRLRRKRRVSLPVVVSFTPVGGRPTARRQRLTLTIPTVVPKAKKVKLTPANARRRPRH